MPGKPFTVILAMYFIVLLPRSRKRGKLNSSGVLSINVVLALPDMND